MPYEMLATQVCSPENMLIPDWQALAVVAMAASAALLGLLYAINRFFGNEAGEAAVKIELFELFTTVFIVVVVFALLNSVCGYDASSLVIAPSGFEQGINIFDGAAQVLDEFSTKLVIIASLLHTIYIPLDFTTSTTLSQHPLGMGTAFQPTGGFGAIMKPPLVQSFQMVAVAFIIIRAQLLVLDFVTFAFLKYYLPIGIILRSFTPTRRIGGTIIGLTLGMVIVYPLLIILNGFMLDGLDILDTSNLPQYFGALLSAAFEPLRNSTDALSLYEPLSILRFGKLVVTGFFGGIVSIYYGLLMRTAAVAFLVGLFFPAFNTLLLVTTIRYLTKTLGEEIDITNLTRLI
ncbi:MAG: hypothetical protein ACLFUZ_00525 [Candidatus Micrarchaeia archaeon]